MIKLLRTTAFLLCTAVAAPAMALDFHKGMEAFDAGDGATARQVWRLLAEQGDGSDDSGNIAVRFNFVMFTRLDERRKHGPVLCACVVTCEECVLSL